MPSISTDLLSTSEDLVSQLQQSATTLASVSRRLEDEFSRRFKDGQVPAAVYVARNQAAHG
jgi:hypothetical protein